MERELKMIPTGEIKDQEYRMRASDDSPDLEALVESVRRLGVLVPLLVRPGTEGYEVVAGHRRLVAAVRVGLLEVPCNVVHRGVAAGWAGAFAENLFRLDLTAVEEAAAIKDCLDEGKMGEVEVASMMHRSYEWVRERVIMLEWPQELLEAVHTGGISVSAARNLARIGDEQHRKALLDFAVEGGVTARVTAAWLQSWQAGASVAERDALPLEPGRAIPPPIEPYTPCVICGTQYKMIDLRYTPICGDCGEELLRAARQARGGELRGGVGQG